MADLKLDTQTYTFDALEAKYSEFFSPIFEISVDGTDMTNEIAVDTIKVETTTDSKADSFTFQVINSFDLVKRDFLWLKDKFVPGISIDIKMGYVDKLIPVFSGYITSVSVEFPEKGTPILNVSGMDISFLLMKGAKSMSWEKKKYSDVVKQIGALYGATIVADDTGTEISNIVQNSINDFHFIQHLAAIVNYDFFVIGKTIYFRKSLTGKESVITLNWGTTLNSLSIDMNISDQITDVAVRGWDDKEHKVIEGLSGSTVQKLGGNAKTGVDIMKKLGTFTEHIYTNVDSEAEAKSKASAMLNYRSMKLISGNGECMGIPEIRAGRYITLADVGAKLSQPYYVLSATHLINNEGYITRFEIGGNAI